VASTCFNHVFQFFGHDGPPFDEYGEAAVAEAGPNWLKVRMPRVQPSREPWTFAWWVPLEREIDDVDIYIYIDMLILYSIYNMIYIHTNYSICWYRWWYMYSIWCIHNPYRWMMIDDGISIAGWWFQTWIVFPIIYGIILPIDFHIFQDG
jgi:hypothetical protein